MVAVSSARPEPFTVVLLPSDAISIKLVLLLSHEASEQAVKVVDKLDQVSDGSKNTAADANFAKFDDSRGFGIGKKPALNAQ